jgi:hypothetical protein
MAKKSRSVDVVESANFPGSQNLHRSLENPIHDLSHEIHNNNNIDERPRIHLVFALLALDKLIL